MFPAQCHFAMTCEYINKYNIQHAYFTKLTDETHRLINFHFVRENVPK
jgi:hypothetical protein